MYIESLVERLNNPYLEDENNEGRIVLRDTVCEYLENYDNHIYDLFLTRAKGRYLDKHGEIYDLYRKENEDDETFRQRILMEKYIVQSTEDFLSIDVVLWIYFNDILDKKTLSSRNVYLKDYHEGSYIFLATGEDSEYIKNKFIINDIRWI